MLLACLLATLAQDPTPAPTIPERLDALIAKTNAYQGFDVRYHLRDKEGVELDLRILFRAPDRARITIHGEKIFSETSYLHGAMELRVHGADTPDRTARISNADAESADRAFVRGLLEEAFPKKLPADEHAAPGAVSFTFEIDPDCSGMGLNAVSGAPERLFWLQTLRKHLTQVSLLEGEPAQIVYSPCEEVRVLYSVENGFVSRVERRKPDGVHVGLELKSLDLDARPDDKEFELPAAGPGAQDGSAELESKFALQGFQTGRGSLFLAVAWMLDDGRLEWSDKIPARTGEILHALAAREMKSIFQPLFPSQLDWMDKVEQWLAASLDQPGARDPESMRVLRDQVDKYRAALAENLSNGMDRLFAHPYPRDRCKAHPELADDLGALERRILAEVYEEAVTKPLLVSFDEKITKQFDEK